jgi:opacity protein-like surface antigen
MKHQRLSAIFVAVTAASLLMVSTAGIAAHKSHKTAVAQQENFKGEANFKAEVPPPCPPVLMLHDGFYIGVGVGYDSYRVHTSTNTSVEDITVPGAPVLLASSAASSNDSATGWMGGIFAGYGRYFDWFYIAAELNANTSNADSTSSFTATDFTDGDTASGYVRLKARGSYGIALLPGIKLNDSSLLYVRLAYLRTNFKANANFTDVDGAGVTNLSLAGSSNEWRNGFNYGVGIETAIAEDVSIRGEFDHTSFNSKSANGSFTGTSIPGPIITANLNDKFNVSNNEFMLSLLYHFA